MIAFHYPPIQGSSGVHRSLAFSRYLPEFGWDVSVLTVNERAHESIAAENSRLIPSNVEVIRAQAWDAARHLSIFGRYPSALALPDRWSSWITFGTWAGMRALRRQRFDAIFSTFPIASAHVIAGNLHQRTRLPWIADFRDPMATPTYPHDPGLRARWAGIQDKTVRAASRVTVTTPGTAGFYQRTYPDVSPERFAVIENGFDPEAFARVGNSPPVSAPSEPLVLLHSGILYPRERDPSAFLKALRRVLDSGVVRPERIRVRLRACGFEDKYGELAAQLGLKDVVDFAPALPYTQALQEMREASALLLFQGKFCNEQIPAKAYEYLYAGRPILGITDPEGDTGRLLRRFGVPEVAMLEDEESLVQMLGRALPKILAGGYETPDRAAVMAVSRRSGAQELAGLLDSELLRRK